MSTTTPHTWSTQNTTISPTGISGALRADSWARQAQSEGVAAADVTFHVGVRCQYQITARSGNFCRYCFRSLMSVQKSDGTPIFSEWRDHNTAPITVIGTLAIGDYQLHADTTVQGYQTGSEGDLLFSLALTPDCPCDWHADASLDTNDFFEFLNSFFAGDADFNKSGSTDSNDFFEFLTCFLSACG